MDFWVAFFFLIVMGFLLPRIFNPLIRFAWICLAAYGIHSLIFDQEEIEETIFSKKELNLIQSMENWSASIRKDLPMRINKDLTLISVDVKNMSLRYNYIVHIAEWDGSHFLALREYAKNISCNDKNIRHYMKNGFLYYFKFSDLNGDEITNTVFSKNNCE